MTYVKELAKNKENRFARIKNSDHYAVAFQHFNTPPQHNLYMVK